MVKFRNDSPFQVTLNIGYENGGYGSVFIQPGDTWEKSFADEQPLSMQWITSPTTMGLTVGVDQNVMVAVVVGDQVPD